MFSFSINQQAHHKPTDTRGRVVGLFKDSIGNNRIEIEYKTTAGEIRTNWVPEQELEPAPGE